MKKNLLLTVTMIVLFSCQTKAQWFSDPFYNWYYSQQIMLNQQMWNMQMQQHQITMQAQQNAQRATEVLSEMWKNSEKIADWIKDHPYESCPYVTPLTSKRGNKVCWACKGRGYCAGCDGEGKIKYRYIYSTGEWTKIKCRACNGTGKCRGCNE